PDERHFVERFGSSRSNTTLISHFDCPGGGQVWVEGTTLFIGHMHWPSGTTIVDVADPRHPRTLATIDLPQGWHSHKVRVANGIMIVNHERLGESGPAEFGGGIAIYDVSRPSTPKLLTKWRTAGPGLPPPAFRWPLRLLVADGRGLRRQHHDDPRSRRSRPPGRGRAVVDPGPVEGRRRALSLGQRPRAALSSSAAHGQSPLCQLLASRALHPGYF